ncbi:MAG: ACT domain-containing protein [Balneola sp.]|nr:MAG: ACT domain-containing protein [Balneola sp.]
MSVKTNLNSLLKNLSPKLNEGEYVFVLVTGLEGINRDDIIAQIKEEEGTTLILNKEKANELGFSYEFVAAWITLTVHSSLEAVGLTAAFSTELAKHDISCNVVAGYYHDHLFVNTKDAQKAMDVLHSLTQQ